MNRSELHRKIATRYEDYCIENHLQKDERITTLMDLEATSRVFPDMRWQEFLDADDENFVHDIFGIKQSIDRSTCSFIKLEAYSPETLFPNHFVPRYA